MGCSCGKEEEDESNSLLQNEQETGAAPPILSTTQKFVRKSVSTVPQHHTIPLAIITGPSGEEEYFGESVSARSVSLFPISSGNRFETDRFHIRVFKNLVLVCLCDGFSSSNPMDTSTAVSDRFLEFLALRMDQIRSGRDAENLLKQALHNISDITAGNTISLSGGVLLKVSDKDSKGQWIFVSVNIGSSSIFHWSASSRQVSDATRNPQESSTTDPLINRTTCVRDDVLILASDGIYENFDPETLRITPEQMNLPGIDWQDATNQKPEETAAVKLDFICKLLARKAFGIKDPNPPRVTARYVTQKAMEYVAVATKDRREFMQNRPDQPIPADYPGKIDNATCVAIQVGEHM